MRTVQPAMGASDNLDINARKVDTKAEAQEQLAEQDRKHHTSDTSACDNETEGICGAFVEPVRNDRNAGVEPITEAQHEPFHPQNDTSPERCRGGKEKRLGQILLRYLVRFRDAEHT